MSNNNDLAVGQKYGYWGTNGQLMTVYIWGIDYENEKVFLEMSEWDKMNNRTKFARAEEDYAVACYYLFRKEVDLLEG